MTTENYAYMGERSTEDLIEYVHDTSSSISFRDAAERELNRRGIETRQKHSGRLEGLELLRRTAGITATDEQPYRDELGENARRAAVLRAEIRALDEKRQAANHAGNPTEADRYDQPISERLRELKRRERRA